MKDRRTMHGVSPPTFDEVSAALSPSGLILRGGFNFGEADVPPPGPSGAPARAVLLVGNAGAAYWPRFQHWRRRRPPALGNPLDTWCREVIGAVAERFGARAASPSDKPYLPFQQWAMRAEGLRPSPLGILMHPEYGLWHAYRGALLFDIEIPVQTPDGIVHLCDSCIERPCLNACPVDAYADSGFDYPGCMAHVRGAAGTRCRHSGCLDRNACPHGAAWRYPEEVQAFHMAAFAHRQAAGRED